MFMGCSLNLVSKLKYQIDLSTIETEYIALSQFMRELIGIRDVIKEIQKFVISGKSQNPKYTALTPRHLSSMISFHQISIKIMNIALKVLQ